MVEKVINTLTGELVEPTVVTHAQSVQFDSQIKYTPRHDAELNSGQYIVDDRDYLTLEQLIARCKRDDPSTYRKIRAGLMSETEQLTYQELFDREKKINDEFFAGDESEISRPDGLGSETGDAEPPTTSVAANPVEDTPQASGTEAVTPEAAK